MTGIDSATDSVPAQRLEPRPWTGDRSSYLGTTAELVEENEASIRAFTQIDLDAAQHVVLPENAPLAGMPIAVKEIIDVEGWRISLGSTTMKERVANHDAESVRRLKEAGAVIAGITTSTPFACGTTTVTANPAAPEHTPGGSSAGSGAAVGAGYVPVALASQSQASTLRPASYCGAWGYKPTHGRLPTQGMHPLSRTLDDLGIIAASLRDLRSTCEVLWEPGDGGSGKTEPPDLENRPLRVGRLWLDDGGLPWMSTLSAFDELLSELAQSDAVELSQGTGPLEVAEGIIDGSGRYCFDIFAGEAAAVLTPLVAAGETDPRLSQMIEHAQKIGPQGLERALARRAEIRRGWASLAEHVDLVISLATTNPAPLGHKSTGCRRLPATSSLLGVPALSAPWLTVEGLPQGVQVIGFEDGDEELLDAAEILAGVLGERTGKTS